MSQVRNKVLAVITHLSNENERLSISKVCKLAEVSRANLYSTYPDLVDKILECSQTAKVGKAPRKSPPRDVDLVDLKRQLSMLAYSCIELRTALDREREKTVRLTDQLRRNQNSKR